MAEPQAPRTNGAVKLGAYPVFNHLMIDSMVNATAQAFLCITPLAPVMFPVHERIKLASAQGKK